MGEFYKSKEFKDLDREWRARLKEEGFSDLEDSRENLKCPDTRTIAHENQNEIREFFIKLDQFIHYYPDMPRFERTVIELYSQGVYIKNITRTVKASDKRVRNVITRYKKLILAINRFMLNADFPYPLEASEVGPRGYRSRDPFKI